MRAFFGAGMVFLAVFVTGSCTAEPGGELCDADDEECQRAILCGNGELDEGEVCDNGPDEVPEIYCSADCSEVMGRCGDGEVQPDFGEVCDGGDGSGGAGGSAGSSGVEPMDGCDECRVVGGFLCSATENSCYQTGVDDDEIAANHLEEVCAWVIALMGGEEYRFYCTVDDKQVVIEAPTLETCVDTLKLRDDCTIGEYEEWATGKGPCKIALETPICAVDEN